LLSPRKICPPARQVTCFIKPRGSWEQYPSYRIYGYQPTNLRTITERRVLRSSAYPNHHYCYESTVLGRGLNNVWKSDMLCLGQTFKIRPRGIPALAPGSCDVRVAITCFMPGIAGADLTKSKRVGTPGLGPETSRTCDPGVGSSVSMTSEVHQCRCESQYAGTIPFVDCCTDTIVHQSMEWMS
jgi:hypothetical protein